MRIVWWNLEKSGSIIHFNYHNNEKVSWEICSSCEKVKISTVLFDTERCCDYLRIAGRKYSGRASIDQIVPKNFTVKFESDYSVTGRGFYLQWNCIEQSKIIFFNQWGRLCRFTDSRWVIISRPTFSQL